MTDSTNKEELSSLPSQDGEMPLSDDPVVLSALFRSLVTESLKTTIEKEADLLQNEILLVTPVRKVNVGIRKRWLEQAVTKHRLTISPWPPWTDVAQRCRFMVENAYITPELRKKIRFIVASEPSIIVNGELHACSSTLFGSSASPPEKEAEIAQEKQRYFDYICRRLIGTGQQHEIEMEVVSGIAAYDLTTSQGVMAELRFPFTIRPFRSREEVETYLRVLCRLTFKGMSLDTEYIGSSNLLVPREFNQAIAASVSEGNILEEEIPIGGDWLHEKLSIKEEVKMGLHISQEFPGGIYLGALVASGAVTSIDGIRLNVLPADDLGRFTLVSRGVHVEGVALLLLALRGEAEEKLGVTYRHNNWQHLIFPKSYTPINTFEYYLTEKELLEAEQKREDHSRSSIWDNPNLPPPKVKRQLLLQANGIEVNPHLHLPLSDFLQNPINTIGTLRELWRMPIGMSSAFIDESALGKLPSARFPVTGNKQGIVDEVNKYQQAVSELKKVRSHEDDQVIFYPMVWQNPKKIVGITILVERDFRLGRREDRYGESWIIEFQHGKRPRDILPGSEGFAKVRFQTVKQVKGDIWEPTGKMSIEMFGIDEDPTTRSEEQTVLWSAIQTMLRKVESKSFRIGVNAIRKYTDKEFVAIEFAYNHQTGEILAIDF